MGSVICIWIKHFHKKRVVGGEDVAADWLPCGCGWMDGWENGSGRGRCGRSITAEFIKISFDWSLLSSIRPFQSPDSLNGRWIIIMKRGATGADVNSAFNALDYL